MNIELIKQKRLMQKMIDVITHIESTEYIYGAVDPKHVKEETEKYSAEYAELMERLVKSCIEAAGMKLKVA